MENINQYNKPQPILAKKLDVDHEIIKIIFSNIKSAIIKALNDAIGLNSSVTQYTVDKLDKTRIQIGIPAEILETPEYVNEYYGSYLLDKFFFAEQHLQQIVFERKKMEQRLGVQNETDKYEKEF